MLGIKKDYTTAEKILLRFIFLVLVLLFLPLALFFIEHTQNKNLVKNGVLLTGTIVSLQNEHYRSRGKHSHSDYYYYPIIKYTYKNQTIQDTYYKIRFNDQEMLGKDVPIYCDASNPKNILIKDNTLEFSFWQSFAFYLVVNTYRFFNRLRVLFFGIILYYILIKPIIKKIVKIIKENKNKDVL